VSHETKGWAGLTLRASNLETRQWSLLGGRATGKLEPPVAGGFDGHHGEFYGEDRDNGGLRPRRPPANAGGRNNKTH
jgi:hypothetical protein